MRYVWDPKKNRRNVARHGIAFEDAIKIFEGPTLEQVDDRFDYGEVHIYAIGVVHGIEVTGPTEPPKSRLSLIEALRQIMQRPLTPSLLQVVQDALPVGRCPLLAEFEFTFEALYLHLESHNT